MEAKSNQKDEIIYGDIPYSEQAKVLLDEMKLDEDDLQKWYKSTRLIGSKDILDFLVNRKKK